jgi:hypothetical protein
VLGLDDAGIAAASPVGGDIETSDLTTLVKIGQDELDASAAATMQMLTEVLGDAVGEAEDAAIASRSGSGQPPGLTLACNISAVPSGQKRPPRRAIRRCSPTCSGCRGSCRTATAAVRCG